MAGSRINFMSPATWKCEKKMNLFTNQSPLQTCNQFTIQIGNFSSATVMLCSVMFAGCQMMCATACDPSNSVPLAPCFASTRSTVMLHSNGTAASCGNGSDVWMPNHPLLPVNERQVMVLLTKSTRIAKNTAPTANFGIISFRIMARHFPLTVAVPFGCIMHQVDVQVFGRRLHMSHDLEFHSPVDPFAQFDRMRFNQRHWLKF